MHVAIVHVLVKPQHVEQFIAEMRRNQEASVQEPGNLRFDVLQSRDDPTRFAIYEAYASEEQAAAHKQTPHYLRWRDAVADWMAQPREGVGYRCLFR